MTDPIYLSVDTVYATAVLSPTRMIAVFYWGRSVGHNKPLILLDFSVEAFRADTMATIRNRLEILKIERRARMGFTLGVWFENQILVQQASYHNLIAHSIPDHLLSDSVWHSLCQAVSVYLTRGDVGYTQVAADAMQARPFLNAAGIAAGPRTDDPTVPAFLYGVVLGLDVALSKDPNMRIPQRTAAR